MKRTFVLLGFAAFGLTPSIRANPNLVQNPGFEDTAPNGAGWTVTLAPSGSYINFGGSIPPGSQPGGNSPHTGSSSANFGSITVGTGLNVDDVITQTVPTISGDKYQVSYWLQTSGETGDVGVSGYAQFVSSFGGQALQNLHDPNPTFNYTEFTYDVNATSSSSVLSFSGQCVHGWFNLDDVSVVDLGKAGVPDAASTIAMLGMVVSGLAFIRRKL